MLQREQCYFSNSPCILWPNIKICILFNPMSQLTSEAKYSVLILGNGVIYSVLQISTDRSCAKFWPHVLVQP